MLNFRVHHISKSISILWKTVETSKRNKGVRSVLGRLTARIDKYNYKLGLETMALMVKPHKGYEAKLRLLAPRARVKIHGLE
jgi:putative transposase